MQPLIKGEYIEEVATEVLVDDRPIARFVNGADAMEYAERVALRLAASLDPAVVSVDSPLDTPYRDIIRLHPFMDRQMANLRAEVRSALNAK